MRVNRLSFYRIRILLLFLCPAIILCAIASCKRTEIDVPLNVDFSFAVQDSNYNVPVTILLANKTQGAQFFKWTFVNGTPAESNYKEPGFVYFDKPGAITIKLEAWNDYDRKEKIIEILLDTVPKARFNVTPRINNISPVDWDFDFTGEGSSQYSWTFEGGTPATSSEKSPRQIHYDIPGQYRVSLRINNHRGRTDTTSKIITVLPALNASFNIIPSFDDDDYEAPLIASLANNTVGATLHSWQCTGASFNNSSDSLPTVSFSSPGNYTVSYTASNGKQTQTVTQSIQILSNSTLRNFQNIKLGINTAHAVTGSFFSTSLRKVIKKDSINSFNGPRIDICFFGLSESFNFNKFISPTDVQNWTFTAIPGATNTVVVNEQETCSCGVNLTPAAFDAITNGNALIILMYLRYLALMMILVIR
jgi:PKD repeat protein